MVNRPSQPEIITVNSEALQTQIRDLLPSQNGFGSELQASNVIFPIIDLTAAATGSSLEPDLQRALSFGSQTTYSFANSGGVLANSPGFYRIFGVASTETTGNASFIISDGLSNKTVWSLTATAGFYAIQHDFVVWLSAGDSISANSTAAGAIMSGSVRQIADSQGVLTNPSGYPL